MSRPIKEAGDKALTDEWPNTIPAAMDVALLWVDISSPTVTASEHKT
jgi:hypothetical protein